MATITLEFDARSKEAKHLIGFLKTISYIKVKENEELSLPEETLQVLEEMRTGDVVVCEDMADYKRKVNNA